MIKTKEVIISRPFFVFILTSLYFILNPLQIKFSIRDDGVCIISYSCGTYHVIFVFSLITFKCDEIQSIEGARHKGDKVNR